MLIKDIRFKAVRELAEKLAKDNTEDKHCDPDHVPGAFSLQAGPGASFWVNVCCNNYQEIYKTHPELCKLG